MNNMNKERALVLLNEVITFYLDAHNDESADIEPTNKEIEEAEKYIEDNLYEEKLCSVCKGENIEGCSYCDIEGK